MFYKIKAKNNQATILEIRSVNIILNVAITYQIYPTKKRHETLLHITEDMGFEPTSKHLPTHLSTTIGYVLI